MKVPVYTPKAQQDLRFILRDSMRLFGPIQARRYADEIRLAGLELASGYREGRPFDEAFPDRLRFKVRSHYIVYRLDREHRVRILRLLHVRMNIADHL